MSSSSKMIALFAAFVCFAMFANAYQVQNNASKYPINKALEQKYIAKWGNGKVVNWVAIKKMTPEQRAEVCKTVHEKTGFGKLEDKDLKETTVQDAYLKFSIPKARRSFTQVLSCKKNNAEQYVYYLTQALEKDSVMLVYPAKDQKFKGKEIFTFTKREQIPQIPILAKF